MGEYLGTAPSSCTSMRHIGTPGRPAINVQGVGVDDRSDGMAERQMSLQQGPHVSKVLDIFGA